MQLTWTCVPPSELPASHLRSLPSPGLLSPLTAGQGGTNTGGVHAGRKLNLQGSHSPAGSLIAVNPPVLNQMKAQAEGSATLAAVERLLPGVDPLVPEEA